MWYEDCEVVGDVMTNNCGEPYVDPNDCYYQEECTGEDEDQCILYGIGCNPPPPPPDPDSDPCQDAQPGADKARHFHKTVHMQPPKAIFKPLQVMAMNTVFRLERMRMEIL
jgi:hypothetical protein